LNLKLIVSGYVSSTHLLLHRRGQLAAGALVRTSRESRETGRTSPADSLAAIDDDLGGFIDGFPALAESERRGELRPSCRTERGRPGFRRVLLEHRRRVLQRRLGHGFRLSLLHLDDLLLLQLVQLLGLSELRGLLLLLSRRPLRCEGLESGRDETAHLMLLLLGLLLRQLIRLDLRLEQLDLLILQLLSLEELLVVRLGD
jgi:hypothetical protein